MNTRYRPHPNAWHGMTVTPETFFVLPRPPGWKYETIKGTLRIEPDWSFVVHEYAGTQGAEPPDGICLVEASEIGAASLADLAADAFEGCPDYFGASRAERLDHLIQHIRLAFDEPRQVRAAAIAAVGAGSHPVGVALARRSRAGHVLTLVCVERERRRSGVARALVAEVARQLPRSPLYSTSLIANRESGRWHTAAGFVELETSIAAASRSRALAWEARAGRATPLEASAAADAATALADEEADGRRPDPADLVIPLGDRTRD